MDTKLDKNNNVKENKEIISKDEKSQLKDIIEKDENSKSEYIEEQDKEFVNTSPNDVKFKKNLVLCGGGVKGIAHVGALFALTELKCLDKIETFAGTSIGSLVISLYVVGYSASELYDFIKLFDLSKLKNLSILNIQLFGLDTGSRIEYVIKRLIKGKGLNENITLKELFDVKKKKIIFTTVCVNTMDIKYLSHETHPNMPLFLAIRMSISLPFIYVPIKYDKKIYLDGDNYLYIDGGCFDNYPINIFKNDEKNTLGINLVDSKDVIENIDNLETYILRVLKCLMVGISFNAKKGFENNTIDIHLESINIVNYEIDNNKKDEIFLKGYKSVINEKEKIFS